MKSESHSPNSPFSDGNGEKKWWINSAPQVRDWILALSAIYMCAVISWALVRFLRSETNRHKPSGETVFKCVGCNNNEPTQARVPKPQVRNTNPPDSDGYQASVEHFPSDNPKGADQIVSAAPNQDFVPGQLLIRFKPGAEPENIQKVLATVNATKEVQPGAAAIHGPHDFGAASTSGSLAGSLILAEVPGNQSNGHFSASSDNKNRCGNIAGTDSYASTIAALAEIRKNPAVDFAEPNYIFRASSAVGNSSNDPGYLQGLLSGLYGPAAVDGHFPNRVNIYGADVDAAWANGNVGSRGIYVGVIDTGIDITHPDLAANIFSNKAPIPQSAVGEDRVVNDLHGWNFFKSNNNVTPTYPGLKTGADSPHGTHVAGIIGAVGGNGIGVVGVNWKVTIIPVRFLGPDETGTAANLVLAINYLVDLKKRENLRLVAINMSFTSAAPSVSVFQAMKAAANKDILLITAAGNGNSFGVGQNDDKSPVYPAAFDTTKVLDRDAMAGSKFNAVVAVAALDDQGNLATFSNFGKSVQLAAPGVHILSTYPAGKYGKLSGTSMAAPFVTGAVALRAAGHPNDTARDIRRALLKSITQTPSLGGQKTFTGGRLDVAKMVQ